MFENLYDENDLESTEHRLRVQIMMLKRKGDVQSLFRLFGVLARVLAQRGDHLKAQDALNDSEFLVVDHKWRGQPNEIRCHIDRALAFFDMGRSEVALNNLAQAEALLVQGRDEDLRLAIEEARQEVGALT